MSATLLNLICSALFTLSNILSLVLFRGVVVLLLLVLWGIRLPGFVIKCFLRHTRESIIELLQFVVELIRDGLASIGSSSSNNADGSLTAMSLNSTISYVKEQIGVVEKVVDCLSAAVPRLFTAKVKAIVMAALGVVMFIAKVKPFIGSLVDALKLVAGNAS